MATYQALVPSAVICAGQCCIKECGTKDSHAKLMESGAMVHGAMVYTMTSAVCFCRFACSTRIQTEIVAYLFEEREKHTERLCIVCYESVRRGACED